MGDASARLVLALLRIADKDQAGAIALLKGSGAGNYFWLAARKTGSIEGYEMAVVVGGDLAQAWLELGWLYFQQSRWDDAVSAASHVLALEPSNVRAMVDVALALERSTEHSSDREVAFLTNAKSAAPGDPRPDLGFGEYELYEGHLSQAAHWFGEASTIDPSNPEPLIGLARVALSKGDWNLALHEAESAAAVGDQNPSAWYWMGTIQIKSGDPCGATRSFQKLLRIQDSPAGRSLLENAFEVSKQSNLPCA
jgi:cytochrome c-type biogenesis protein CcmH/NrfG